jgi:hypothetical protein
VNPPRRTLASQVKSDPIASVLWIVTPIVGAWAFMHDRFPGIRGLLLEIVIGLAIGLSALFAISRGWLHP